MQEKPQVEIARFTSNVEATTRFYADVLGQPPDSADSQSAKFSRENIIILIHSIPPENPEYPPSEDHIAFPSHDLDQRFQQLAKRYDIISPPKDYPWGRSAYLRDPDGRLVELSDTR